MTYRDIAMFSPRGGSRERTVTAPNGWKVPDPMPESSAMPTRIGKLGAKPAAAKLIAVQARARPVKRVPQRSATNPNTGWDTAPMPV